MTHILVEKILNNKNEFLNNTSSIFSLTTINFGSLSIKIITCTLPTISPTLIVHTMIKSNCTCIIYSKKFQLNIINTK
jgi:hypothetical protein